MLMIFLPIVFEEIREEENLENNKYDKQLNQDDGPESSPQSHVAEPVIIKVKNPVEEALFAHILFC